MVVTTRKYEQRLRADSAEETRRRILHALAAQLREAPAEPVALDAVAGRAKVARSTIYTVFGSRAGLFDEFVADLWERTGLSALTAAVAITDARTHLREGIAAANRMYAADRGIYRVLFSLASIDPAGVGGATRKKEQNRAGGMVYLAQRLREGRALRSDVTDEQAVDTLWVLCSFETFDALYSGRGLTVAQATELTVTMAERMLCTPDLGADGRTPPGARKTRSG